MIADEASFDLVFSDICGWRRAGAVRRWHTSRADTLLVSGKHWNRLERAKSSTDLCISGRNCMWVVLYSDLSCHISSAMRSLREHQQVDDRGSDRFSDAV